MTICWAHATQARRGRSSYPIVSLPESRKCLEASSLTHPLSSAQQPYISLVSLLFNFPKPPQRKSSGLQGVQPKPQSIKEKIDKLYIIKIKSLCSMKDLVRPERQAAHHLISDKGLVSRICKDPSKGNNKKTIRNKN